jgi:hypothetical protein
VLGAIEFLGDEPAVPDQDGRRFGDTGNLFQCFPPKPFSDLGERGSLWIGQAQLGVPQDAVLSRQISILQQQLWVYEARHIRK